MLLQGFCSYTEVYFVVHPNAALVVYYLIGEIFLLGTNFCFCVFGSIVMQVGRHYFIVIHVFAQDRFAFLSSVLSACLGLSFLALFAFISSSIFSLMKDNNYFNSSSLFYRLHFLYVYSNVAYNRLLIGM